MIFNIKGFKRIEIGSFCYSIILLYKTNTNSNRGTMDFASPQSKTYPCFILTEMEWGIGSDLELGMGSGREWGLGSDREWDLALELALEAEYLLIRKGLELDFLWVGWKVVD